MTGSNRRTFLATAGAGAAAVGAVALAPSVLSTSAAAAPATAGERPLELPAAAAGSMVAYVHDVAKGEVSVMVEGREVTITDHQLVAKLAHALHTSPSKA